MLASSSRLGPGRGVDYLHIGDAAVKADIAQVDGPKLMLADAHERAIGGDILVQGQHRANLAVSFEQNDVAGGIGSGGADNHEEVCALAEERLRGRRTE